MVWAHQYNLVGKSPYIVNQFQRFGFLNIDIIDNGKLVGNIIDSNDGHNRPQVPLEDKVAFETKNLQT
jgi:hypothetical protein